MSQLPSARSMTSGFPFNHGFIEVNGCQTNVLSSSMSSSVRDAIAAHLRRRLPGCQTRPKSRVRQIPVRFVVPPGTFSRGTDMTDLDPWYVTGFAEGQGSFTYSRNGKQLSLYFAVKLAEADEPILQAIRDFFGGIGSIYLLRARASAYYRVCRREQLPVIIDHFDTYP